MKNLFIWVVVLTLFACDRMDSVASDVCPSCLQSIKQSSNPPIEIWSYTYNNQIVYLSKADCCDQYDQLYSRDCSLLCAPSGGFTGKGDGKCSDFYEKATDGKLLWKKE